MDEQRIAPRSKKQATGGNIIERIRPKGNKSENADIQNEDAADNEAEEEEGEDEQMEEDNAQNKRNIKGYF